MTSQRIAVLHLVESFRRGGSEGQAIQLIGLLQRSGRFEIQVASLHADGPLRAQLGPLPVEAFPLSSFHDGLTVRQLRRFASLLRERNIHILQTHDFYTNVFGMVAGTLAGVSVRIAARRDTVGVRGRAHRVLEKLAYRLAHSVVANGEAVKLQLISEGVAAHKIAVIHNGVDYARFAIGDRPRAELARRAGLAAQGLDRPTVTLVANMHLAVKDQPTFLRAARRVLATRADARFVLAGEGRLMEPLRACAGALGLEQSTVFLGSCGDIGALLELSDVCVLSSRGEGFPNAILEYMAAARPVVATSVGAVSEAVVDGVTGFLTTPGDDQAMAERISELLANPERAMAMGRAGQARVLDRFTTAAQVDRVEALYDALTLAKLSRQASAT